MRSLIAIVALTCAAFQAHAEKWVNVGVAVSQELGRVDIYADAESAVRTGDLVTIKFKSLVEPRIEETNFDCKKDLMFSKFGDQASTTTDLVGKGGKVTWPVSLLKNMQTIACKRSYEFWK